MKIDRKDVHDRFQYFTKQQFSISACCDDLVQQRPFGNHPFYIWVHARTDDFRLDRKRMIWQPRLTRPKPQTNSMLFKAYPGTDNIKVIWMIPERSQWKNYQKGQMCQNQTIYESIMAFEHNRASLEEPDLDDLNDVQIDQIYKELAMEGNRKKAMNNLWVKG